MTNRKPKPPSPLMSKTSFGAEDLPNLGIGKEWNEKIHKVNLIVHTPHGTVSMKTELMKEDQIDEFRTSLRGRILSNSGYLDVKTDDGFVLLPHQLLVNSVIQLYIDAEEKEEKEETKEETKE